MKEVCQGFAIAAATTVSPYHRRFKEAELEPIPFDPGRARSLLQDADTNTPILPCRPEWMPEHAVNILRFVAASLEAVGFTVSIEVDRSEYARSIGLRKQIGDLALFHSTPNSTFRVLDDKVSSEAKNTWWLGYHDEECRGYLARREGGFIMKTGRRLMRSV